MALQKLTGTGESMEQVRTKVNTAFDKVDSLDSSVSDLNSSVTAIGTDVGKLKTDNTQNKSDITKLKSDVQSLQGVHGGGYSVSASPPSDTSLLWFDTSSGNVLKFYNGTAWVISPAVWG